MEREIKEKMELSVLTCLSNFEEVICAGERDSEIQEAYGHFILLTAFYMDTPEAFIEDGNLQLLNTLVTDVLSVISPFDRNTVVTKLYRIDFITRLYQLLTKGRSRMVEPKLCRIYPMIGQLEFIDHVIENLKELVMAKADSIAFLRFFILKHIDALQVVSSNLKLMSQERKGKTHLKHLLPRITDCAYDVGWIIESFMVREFPIWNYMSLLLTKLKMIQNFERELRTELDDIQQIDFVTIDTPGFYLQILPSVEERHERLLELFNHLLIVTGYEVRLWCVCSSYRERKKEVFLQLLQNASFQHSGVADDDDKITYTSDMSQDELETSVREFLINKWSFIILEDVEDIDTLHDIIRVLPNPGYKGIILLATRLPELAVQIDYSLQKFLYSRNSQDRTSKSAINLRSTDSDGGGDVVGFKEEIGTMLELLIGGHTKLHLISIFGMAGLGKTTLAKKLYNDRIVIEHFDIRAWCYVSQVYETKKLLLELLSHIVQMSDTIRHMDEGELADMLRKNLLGRRFFIVLDDIWSIEAWNDIRRCFPNDKNGSRIIFTTRLHELATQAQSGSILQPLGFLSENESWELLRKKLFEKESCPEILLEVGTQIATGCKGLPIAIVLVAGVLAKTERTKDQWTRVLESLTTCVLGDANDYGKGIIELSYMHLPDHLKLCFLYFGQFSRDREVSISKIIRMLIAEGLIRPTESKCVENVAEDCLMELIGRSLVMVSQEKSNGGVKSCRVHDLIQEFCLTKAKEELFLQQIHGYNEHFPSSDNYEDYGMDPNYNYSSKPVIYFLHRICIYSKRNHFIMLEPFGPEVRSLSFLPASDTHPSYPYDISFISHNFKHLIKLNLEDINIGESFNAIMVLVHLKYLAVQGYVDCIPSSIVNLWKLETFLVENLRAKVVDVPDAICDMVKLRHLHINNNASFKLDTDRSENFSILDNLQTLSKPILTHGGDMEKILRRVKGIKRLKCIFLDSWDDITNCNKFPNLGFLSQLISLKVSYDGVGKSPCEFDFPSNLTKLTLLNFRKPWSEISQLAKLNNLNVLKLLSNAFEGKTWDMEDEMFSKLKFLKLDTLDVEEWIAESVHFPLLEHLILNQCEQLEKIPSCIGDIDTLKKIEVMWCKQSVTVSAKEIEEEQMQYGNAVKIHVHPDVAS